MLWKNVQEKIPSYRTASVLESLQNPVPESHYSYAGSIQLCETCHGAHPQPRFNLLLLLLLLLWTLVVIYIVSNGFSFIYHDIRL